MPATADHLLPTPLDTLRDALSRGVTGRLWRGGTRGGGREVYVMQGQILAAHGPDDGPWLVRRLVNTGALTERQGKAFIRRLTRGTPFDELILGHVPDSLLSTLLAGRFRQNLLDYLSTPPPVQFQPMDTLFVPNIQSGHDTRSLLASVVALRERIGPLMRHRGPLTLRPGPSMPGSRDEARLVDLCDPPLSLRDLLTFSPFETGETLDHVMRLLTNGALVSDEGIRLSHPRGHGPTADYAVEELFSLDIGEPQLAGHVAPPIPPELVALLREDVGSASEEDFGELPTSLRRTYDSAHSEDVGHLHLVEDLPADALSDMVSAEPPEPPTPVLAMDSSVPPLTRATSRPLLAGTAPDLLESVPGGLSSLRDPEAAPTAGTPVLSPEPSRPPDPTPVTRTALPLDSHPPLEARDSGFAMAGEDSSFSLEDDEAAFADDTPFGEVSSRAGLATSPGLASIPEHGPPPVAEVVPPPSERVDVMVQEVDTPFVGTAVPDERQPLEQLDSMVEPELAEPEAVERPEPDVPQAVEPEAVEPEAVDLPEPEPTVAEAVDLPEPEPTVAEAVDLPEPTVAEAVDLPEPEPTVTEAVDLPEPEPQVPEAVEPEAVELPEPVVAEAVEPEPTVAEAVEAAEPEPTVAEAVEAAEPEPTVAEAVEAAEPEPSVAETVEVTEPEPTVAETVEVAEPEAVELPEPEPEVAEAVERPEPTEPPESVDGSVSVDEDRPTIAEPDAPPPAAPGVSSEAQPPVPPTPHDETFPSELIEPPYVPVLAPASELDAPTPSMVAAREEDALFGGSTFDDVIEPDTFAEDAPSIHFGKHAPPAVDAPTEKADKGDILAAARRALQQATARRKEAARRPPDQKPQEVQVSHGNKKFTGFDFDLDDSELGLFEDHDRYRGAGQGQFTLDKKLLDKVDLRVEQPRRRAASVEEEDDDIIEMGEATPEEEKSAGVVALAFSAPQLDADQALQKIEVGADVAQAVARQLDQLVGPGAGQTAVQLLVASAAGPYSRLFHEVEVSPLGRIDETRVLINVEQRPKAERRFLLDRGIKDFIERALSTAAEELSDIALDILLEEIAGYQQRLRV